MFCQLNPGFLAAGEDPEIIESQRNRHDLNYVHRSCVKRG